LSQAKIDTSAIKIDASGANSAPLWKKHCIFAAENEMVESFHGFDRKGGSPETVNPFSISYVRSIMRRQKPYRRSARHATWRIRNGNHSSGGRDTCGSPNGT
jgi:hypothetical protein